MAITSILGDEYMSIHALLLHIEHQPQRQDAVLEQLNDLVLVANHLGMYDAADVLTTFISDLERKHRERSAT